MSSTAAGSDQSSPAGISPFEPSPAEPSSDRHSSDSPSSEDASSGRSVVIVGAGLAGLAAALRLAERDVAVTLVETRNRLGGRAGSFEDSQSGEVLDNCQHVLMRACTNLLNFYQRLGVADRLHWYRSIHFAYPTDDGRTGVDVLAADDLPAPLHLTQALLGFGGLSVGDKLAICRGMLAIMQVSRRGRGLYQDTSFAHWLGEHNQPRSTIEKFWSIVIVSACNESIERVPASYGFQVFQEGFLYRPEAGQFALPTTSLQQLYDPAQAMIEKAGGKIHHGVRAANFTFDDSTHRITGLRTADGQELIGDAFLSAIPADRLARLTNEAMKNADDRLEHLDAFDSSPIIGVHLFFARRGGQSPRQASRTSLADADDGSANHHRTAWLGMDHLVLQGSELQWVFDKGVVEAGPFAGSEHLHGVISAAHEWVDTPPQRIVDMALAELRRFFPHLGEAKLVHSRVIKEKQATFSARPGVDHLRPTAAGPIDNLFIAGDWTRTHWPATMEGAVRSGYTAAAATLDSLGVARDLETPVRQPPIEPSPLYRLLSG